jgi:hypothetical protein
MGWEILSIVGVVVCILLVLGYMMWWPKKEGFQTAPAVVSGTTRVPIPFTCAAGETPIPCPEGSTQCCKVNDGFGSQYVMLRKEDGPDPVAPAPERLGVSLTPIDESATGDAWQAYQDAEDDAAAALDAAAPPPAPPPPVPDYGSSLGSLDTDVSTIPWDADNATVLESDVVWGYVSPEASKSIWNKVYAQNALNDPRNVSQDGNGKFTYVSPLLGISTNDPNTAMGMQIGEFLAENAAVPVAQGKLERAASTGAVKLKSAIGKSSRALGSHLKNVIGPGKFKALRPKFAGQAMKWFQKKISSFMQRFIVKKVALEGSLAGTAAALSAAAAIPPFVLAPAAAAATATATLVTTVLTTLQIVTMAVSILLGPVLDQLIDSEGMCPPGSKSYNLILPPAASSIILNSIPIIGDILDLLAPYVCFSPDGKVFIKDKIKGQPYAEDTTLSVTYAAQVQPTGETATAPAIVPPPLERFAIQNPNGSTTARDWCNFANPIMLDRMANFYYKYAFANPVDNYDDTVSVTYISRFIGVIASSELSCDVVCTMTTVTYDPIQGDNVTLNDEGPVYRRFYCIKGPADPQGYFTVTGCTHEDDCAPDATMLSSDVGGNYVPSLPKIFNVKVLPSKAFDWKSMAINQGVALAGTGLSMRGGFAGSAVTAAGSSALTNKLMGVAGVTQPRDMRGSYIYADPTIPGNFKLQSTDDYYYIDRGTVIETAYGYGPEIKFCSGSQLTVDQCANQYRLRTIVDAYHLANPAVHIKTIYAIEPRGRDACYYKWSVAAFNAATNEEQITTTTEEVLAYYKMKDELTCVWYLDTAKGKGGFVPYSGDSAAGSCAVKLDTTTTPIKYYTDWATCYTAPRVIPIPPSQQPNPQTTVLYPTRKKVVDAAARVSYVPVHPVTPFSVPKPMPLAGLALKGCPTATCGTAEQITQSIADFNEAHRDRKIQKVLKAWTSGVIPVELTEAKAAAEGASAARAALLAAISKASAAQTKVMATATTVQAEEAAWAATQGAKAAAEAAWKAALPAGEVAKSPATAKLATIATGQDATKAIANASAIAKAVAIADLVVKAILAKGPVPVQSAYDTAVATAATDLQKQANVLQLQKKQDQTAILAAGGKIPASVSLAAIESQVADAAAAEAALQNAISRAQIAATRAYTTAQAASSGMAVSARCDYLVEMLRVMPDGTRVVQKESVAMTMAPAKGADGKATCLFSRVADGSDKVNSGTFIQSETPELTTPDTSGGIFGYKAVVASIQNTLAKAIQPLIRMKPDKALPDIATESQKAVQTLAQQVFNSQTLEACPEKTCKDPDILAAIMTQYNDDMFPAEEFYVEKHTMTRALKSGIASKNQCDVIFADRVEEYDDVFQKPVKSTIYGRTYRFKLTPTGAPCSGTGGAPYRVKPKDYYDASFSQVGVRSSSTTIDNGGFTMPTTTMDCRKSSVLSAIKTYLAAQNARTSPTDASTYNQVLWSFNRGANSCEYKVLKDVTYDIGGLDEDRQMDIETFLKVDFDPATKAVRSAAEYDLGEVDQKEDSDGNKISFIKGVKVQLPFLTNYDETPTPLVNTTSSSFPLS